MKKFKHRIFVAAIITILSLPTNANLPLNIHQSSNISININNLSHIVLYNARIKLNIYGDWVSIGNISLGQNNFIIQGGVDNQPNLFEAQLDNDQWFVGIYEKEPNSKIIMNIAANIDISAQQALKSETGRAIPDLILYQSSAQKHKLRPVALKDANHVSVASCANTSNGFYCYMSQYNIYYHATGTSFTTDYPTGYFAARLKPAELIQQYGSAGSTTYIFKQDYISVSPHKAGSFSLFEDIGDGQGAGYFSST